MVRQPAVAGQFYPGAPGELAAQVNEFMKVEAEPEPALMVVSPHAGYMYSGRTAGQVVGRVDVPPRVILVGPNHRGLGAQAALMTQGQWETPLGLVTLDEELAARLLEHSRLLEEDTLAHQFEHSLEVQVPFLQARRPDLKLTPLCLGSLSYAACQEIGQALAQVVQALDQPVLLVASTDMSHYEPVEAARQKDMKAIEHILALDPQGLYDTVRNLGITMCGVLPTTVCLVAAKHLGAEKAELVEYTNSGAATGDYRQVVGYAGLIVK